MFITMAKGEKSQPFGSSFGRDIFVDFRDGIDYAAHGAVLILWEVERW